MPGLGGLLDTPELWSSRGVLRIVGPLSLFLIVCMSLNVAISLYCCLLPWKLYDWPLWRFSMHIVMAHIVLGNLSFHFYRTAFTSPGRPLDLPGKISASDDGWCRKCSERKPPTTHHCSICSKCVLRMDHHCVWTNNCVGWANHRHFVFFCILMTVACLYVFFSGYSIWHSHVHGAGIDFGIPIQETDNKIVGTFQLDVAAEKAIVVSATSDNEKIRAIFQRPVVPFRSAIRWHRFIQLIFFLALPAGFLVAILAFWHIGLVSRGATSIDDLGGQAPPLGSMWQNRRVILRHWLLFLGFYESYLTKSTAAWIRNVIRCIVLPSLHKPTPLDVWVRELGKFEKAQRTEHEA